MDETPKGIFDFISNVLPEASIGVLWCSKPLKFCFSNKVKVKQISLHFPFTQTTDDSLEIHRKKRRNFSPFFLAFSQV